MVLGRIKTAMALGRILLAQLTKPSLHARLPPSDPPLKDILYELQAGLVISPGVLEHGPPDATAIGAGLLIASDCTDITYRKEEI